MADMVDVVDVVLIKWLSTPVDLFTPEIFDSQGIDWWRSSLSSINAILFIFWLKWNESFQWPPQAKEEEEAVAAAEEEEEEEWVFFFSLSFLYLRWLSNSLGVVDGLRNQMDSLLAAAVLLLPKMCAATNMREISSHSKS